MFCSPPFTLPDLGASLQLERGFCGKCAGGLLGWVALAEFWWVALAKCNRQRLGPCGGRIRQQRPTQEPSHFTDRPRASTEFVRSR